MQSTIHSLSALELVFVRLFSFAGLSKSLLVICALWALPFLRPKSPVLNKRDRKHVCVSCVRTKAAHPKHPRHKPKHPHPSQSPVKPTNPFRFPAARKALASAISSLVHPFTTTSQGKRFVSSRRPSNSDTNNSSSSSTPPPPSPTTSEPHTDSPPTPVRPSPGSRRSSILLRQHIAHAAANAAKLNVFRKQKLVPTSPTSTDTSILPPLPVSPKDSAHVVCSFQTPAPRKPLQRRATVHFSVQCRSPFSRPRARSVGSALSIVAPIMEVSDSTTTVTPPTACQPQVRDPLVTAPLLDVAQVKRKKSLGKRVANLVRSS